jgi:hypothetical protein
MMIEQCIQCGRAYIIMNSALSSSILKGGSDSWFDRYPAIKYQNTKNEESY